MMRPTSHGASSPAAAAAQLDEHDQGERGGVGADQANGRTTHLGRRRDRQQRLRHEPRPLSSSGASGASPRKTSAA